MACVPVNVAFMHIIFPQSELFGPYYPMLLKVIMLSSCLHQFVFSCMSSLPFSIGQVQDVGLIFLAAIVRSIIDLRYAQHEAHLKAERHAGVVHDGHRRFDTHDHSISTGINRAHEYRKEQHDLKHYQSGIKGNDQIVTSPHGTFTPEMLDEIVATCLYTFSIATTLTGCAVFMVGLHMNEF